MTDFDDIPVIQRAAATAPIPVPTTKRPLPKPPVLAAVAGMVVAVGLGLFLLLPKPGEESPKAAQASAPASGAKSASAPAGTLLGHYRYKEAFRGDLVQIDFWRDTDRPILLHKGAVESYRQLVQAARAEGVILVTLSGFRSERYQQEVYARQLGKAGTTSTATLINAPPGYSEHHTGYAIDFGDGTVPGANLRPRFEQTVAFRWLTANARKFGFEMSFPKDNPQRVSYEPWHWRYVGDKRSIETFYLGKGR
ncbi:M15 family metallopeptidase [Gloeobacter violaceus]|uniref:Glr2377 protein n=1 Tax=Gloeobacter violaceus (strain ATCC 29082 / PCC 7421) TaxID=251221 RepID=Q7NI07_GLOVI|nr:M15 family metallopeptidase [Gloeobacter violaceus]BAC90318.1 glr2377 [Gloeobacter violaceus PCC 7421]